MSHFLLPSRVARAAAAAALGLAVLAGCQDKPRVGPLPIDPQLRISAGIHPVLRDTVGEFAAMVDAAPIAVEGYGVVAGLPGTGSGDMDPKLREHLRDQLLRAGAGSYVNGTQRIDPDKILSSNEIAVVEVRGILPPLARRPADGVLGTTFDLTVTALPGSQTTSLANGLLWTTELKVVGLTTAGNDSATIAMGRGPVFIPAPVEAAAGQFSTTQPGAMPRALRTGRVLGGGVCAIDRPIRLQLYSPNYYRTAAIERTINARFPGREKVATAEGDAVVSLHIPADYALDPYAFVDLVRRLYLRTDNPGFAEERAAQLIEALKLPDTPHRDISLALQGLGRSILPDFLQPYYTAADPEVRFWCARAGAGLGDVGGMTVLQEILKDPASPFRLQALDGLVAGSRGRDTVRASLALADMLNSPNTENRIVAYRGLLGMRSRLVSSYSVGRKFVIDIVPANSPPMIYITQADTPRIAFIGRPLTLPPGALYISPDNLLTVAAADNAPDATLAPGGSGQVLTAASVGDGQNPAAAPKESVTLYWRSPDGEKTVNLKTVPSIPELVARATWIPDPRAADFNPNDPYIGASYQRVTEMLATLCRDQLLEAKFVLQKAPPPILSQAEILRSGRPEGSTEKSDAPAPRPDTPAQPGAEAAPEPGPGMGGLPEAGAPGGAPIAR
jgi:hypothetical protein